MLHWAPAGYDGLLIKEITMPDATLLLLANDVRKKTLKLLEGLTDAQSRFAPSGLNNTILWHAGHVYVVNEHLGVSPATGKPPEYPQGWFDTFSWKSNPAQVLHWPPLEQIVAKLHEQLPRLTDAITALSPDQLNQIVGDPSRNRTLRWSILHGLHDEANHQGEIWLLRKVYDRQKQT
jgi:hypothetical protein